MSHCLRLL
jgi:hypothetical protein